MKDWLLRKKNLVQNLSCRWRSILEQPGQQHQQMMDLSLYKGILTNQGLTAQGKKSLVQNLSCRWRSVLERPAPPSLFFLSAASTNEGPCASFSNSARMPLIFLMGIYVKNKIYEPQRTRRRRKNKDLGTAAGRLSTIQWNRIFWESEFKIS